MMRTFYKYADKKRRIGGTKKGDHTSYRTMYGIAAGGDTENAGVEMLASVTVKIFDARRTSPTCYKTNSSNRVFHELTAVHTICSSFC